MNQFHLACAALVLLVALFRRKHTSNYSIVRGAAVRVSESEIPQIIYGRLKEPGAAAQKHGFAPHAALLCNSLWKGMGGSYALVHFNADGNTYCYTASSLPGSAETETFFHSQFEDGYSLRTTVENTEGHRHPLLMVGHLPPFVTVESGGATFPELLDRHEARARKLEAVHGRRIAIGPERYAAVHDEYLTLVLKHLVAARVIAQISRDEYRLRATRAGRRWRKAMKAASATAVTADRDVAVADWRRVFPNETVKGLLAIVGFLLCSDVLAAVNAPYASIMVCHWIAYLGAAVLFHEWSHVVAFTVQKLPCTVRLHRVLGVPLGGVTLSSASPSTVVRMAVVLLCAPGMGLLAAYVLMSVAISRGDAARDAELLVAACAFFLLNYVSLFPVLWSDGRGALRLVTLHLSARGIVVIAVSLIAAAAVAVFTGALALALCAVIVLLGVTWASCISFRRREDCTKLAGGHRSALAEKQGEGGRFKRTPVPPLYRDVVQSQLLFSTVYPKVSVRERVTVLVLYFCLVASPEAFLQFAA